MGEHPLQNRSHGDDDSNAVIDTAFGGETKLVYCSYDRSFRVVAMQMWRNVSTLRQQKSIYELNFTLPYADSVLLQITEKKIKCGGKLCCWCKPEFRSARKPCGMPTSLYFLLGPKQEHAMNSVLHMIAATIVDRPQNAHLYFDNVPKHKIVTKRQRDDDQDDLTRSIEKEIDARDPECFQLERKATSEQEDEDGQNAAQKSPAYFTDNSATDVLYSEEYILNQLKSTIGVLQQ